MSRDPNLHIPEIEKVEERKEKLRENLRVRLPALTDFEIDYVVVVADMYAQEKIDQIFNEENHRKGMSAEELETHLKNTPDEVIKALVDKETI